MLLECIHVTYLWDQVCQWMSDVRNTDYSLSNRRKIVGGKQLFNIIILATKNIYNSKVDGNVPSIYQVKNCVKQMFYHEKYMARIRGKTGNFENKWSLLIKEWVKPRQRNQRFSYF